MKEAELQSIEEQVINDGATVNIVFTLIDEIRRLQGIEASNK